MGRRAAGLIGLSTATKIVSLQSSHNNNNYDEDDNNIDNEREREMEGRKAMTTTTMI